jgi:hypothetical protein
VKEGLDFLLWHLTQKNVDDIRRFFWHGHDMVKELLLFSKYDYSPNLSPLKTILDWLETMYNPDEGCFIYYGKPISKMSARIDGGTSRVMKYRLFHLIETDWFTYYMARIISNYL